MSNIIVGVTGSISAYKVSSLVSILVNGTDTFGSQQVKVVMTENAKKFITPLTLATLSKNPVYDDASEWCPDGEIKHIELSSWGDILIIAPATANTIVKMSQGIADNLLTSIFLAWKGKPVFIAPAMNPRMWENNKVQGALRNLSCFVHIIFPVEGKMACGDTGMGKLASTKSIIEACWEKFLKSAILTFRQKVRTIAPLHDDQYTKESLKSRQWGVEGIILSSHNSHGLCYDVLHDDGTVGTYDPDELDPAN